jgi:hypothetical protein
LIEKLNRFGGEKSYVENIVKFQNTIVLPKMALVKLVQI